VFVAVNVTKNENKGRRFQSKRKHAVNANKPRTLLAFQKPYILIVDLEVGAEIVGIRLETEKGKAHD
jgi:hypothetical protein